MVSVKGGFEFGIEKAKELCPKDTENGLQGTGSTTTGCSKQFDRSTDRFACIGYSEIDRYASAIYRYHYPDHRNFGDATAITWRTVPDFDLLVGGIPCQAWSIAGKRKGFEDSRGTLWFEYFRCLKEKQPTFFIAENVKGILSHNNGDSFEQICVCFCELGYAIDFEVLNSKNFGVPQNRQRVFITGVRIDLLDKTQIF